MPERIVLVDVDDVCGGFVAALVDVYNHKWRASLRLEQVTEWDLAKIIPEDRVPALWDLVRRPEFYGVDVRPVPGALTGVRKLRALGYRVVFATASAQGTADAKVEWLKRHAFLDRPENLVTLKDKALLRGDVLVDDGLHNVESFPGPTILFDMPHNRKSAHAHRAHSWDDVVTLVQHLAPVGRIDPDAFVAAMIPVAQEAARGQRLGITVADVRDLGLRRGVLTGREDRQTLAALAVVMRRAGLVNFGERRRSPMVKANGAMQTVWYEEVSNAA